MSPYENRKQHFVPSFFLQRFSLEPDRKRAAPLYAYDLDLHREFLSCAGNLMNQRDYYTDSTLAGRLAEKNFHGQVEFRYQEVLQKLDYNEIVYGVEDMVNMALSVGYMFCRSVTFANNSRSQTINVIGNHSAQIIACILFGTPYDPNTHSIQKLNRDFRQTLWDQ